MKARDYIIVTLNYVGKISENVIYKYK